MTKSELIMRITEEHNMMNKRQIEFIINNVLSSIKTALAKGDRVEIRGFGSFRTRKKGPKTARNPRTGVAVQLLESTTPYFRPGKEIREQLLAKD